MDNLEYEKYIKELEGIKEENQKQIILNNEKAKEARVNGFDHKFTTTLACSLVSYLLLFLLSFGLTSLFGASIITSIFPGITFPLVFVGSSLGLGLLGRKILFSKSNGKNGSARFWNSKSEKEKLRLEVRYQIEAEKFENRNKAIDETIKILNSEQKFTISTFDSLLLTKDELLKNQDELLKHLDGQYSKLDEWSTKKVLHDKFYCVREKFHRITQLISTALFSLIVTMLLASFPFMFIMPYVTLGMLFSSLVTGSLISTLYLLKRNDDYKSVFNKLNAKLFKNSLCDKMSKEIKDGALEEKEINGALDEHIVSVALATIKLQENKCALDKCADEMENDKLFSDCVELSITDGVKNDIVNKGDEYDYRTRSGKFDTDSALLEYIETSLDSELPVTNNETVKKKSLKKRK